MVNKFVIKLNSWGNQNYYSKHGEFAGKEEVMGYTTKKYAKQFETEEDAGGFISTLPEWTKSERFVVEEVTVFDII